MQEEIRPIIEDLECIAEVNKCECVDEPPYIRCRACTAAHALNEIGEIAREALCQLEKG